MGTQEDGIMAGGGEHVALLGLAAIAKGKRTKRQRVHAPPAPATVVESSSAAEASSTTSTAEEAVSGCVTEEEEDMAHCLMLLAQGHGRVAQDVKDGGGCVTKEEKFRSRRPAETDGEYVYECKTCNKCFPSFQALGGHRASHKKLRLLPPPPPSAGDAVDAQDKKDAADAEDDKLRAATNSSALSKSPMASSRPRIHECSICGAEFSSGQALGGHMRRHRPLVPAATEPAATTTTSAQEDGVKKERNQLLELDLNLPAPCNDGNGDGDGGGTSWTPMVFSAASAPAAALVDCHY